MVEHADHFHLPPTIQTEPKFGRLPMDAEKKKSIEPRRNGKRVYWMVIMGNDGYRGSF